MNILASNFIVDRSFSTTNAPKELELYRQYFIDGNQQLYQLTDDYSVQEWFCGVNPMGRSWDNFVEHKTLAPQLPDRGNSLQAIPRTYAQSNTGLGLRITNIGYCSCQFTVYRLKGNGDIVLRYQSKR